MCHRIGLLSAFLSLMTATAAGMLQGPAADETRLVRIQQLIASGNLRAASAEVASALEAMPRDPRLYNFRGVIEAQQQNLAAAESSFREAIELAPRFTGAYFNFSRLYLQHPDESSMSKALELYRCLLQFEPDNPEANYQSAWILYRLGRFASSLRHLNRLPENARRKAAALALRCADQAALGEVSQAEASGKELLAAADLTEADVLTVVPVLTRHKRLQLATALVEAVDSRGIVTAAGLDQLATLYEGSGEFKKARTTLERELGSIGQPSAALLMRLGRTAYKAGDLDGALGYLAHARDLEPRNAAIHLLFGIVCIDLKLPPEARQSLDEALRLEPRNPYANYALGAVLLQEKKPEEALRYFQKYREARPLDATGMFASGVAYFDAHMDDEATRELETAARYPETRTGANLYLGRLAMRGDRLEDAVAFLRRAIEANPSAPDAYAELGLVGIHQHEYALAGRNLAEAVRLAPDHYRANLNLLMLYQRTNDPRAAEQAKRLEKVQKAGEERERLLLRSLEIRPN
jgi:tetratricopeptide (TPR) repeat protein